MKEKGAHVYCAIWIGGPLDDDPDSTCTKRLQVHLYQPLFWGRSCTINRRCFVNRADGLGRVRASSSVALSYTVYRNLFDERVMNELSLTTIAGLGQFIEILMQCCPLDNKKKSDNAFYSTLWKYKATLRYQQSCQQLHIKRNQLSTVFFGRSRSSVQIKGGLPRRAQCGELASILWY